MKYVRSDFQTPFGGWNSDEPAFDYERTKRERLHYQTTLHIKRPGRELPFYAPILNKQGQITARAVIRNRRVIYVESAERGMT